MRTLLRMYVSDEVPSWAVVWRLRETRSKWGGNQVTESLECLDAKVEPWQAVGSHSKALSGIIA